MGNYELKWKGLEIWLWISTRETEVLRAYRQRPISLLCDRGVIFRKISVTPFHFISRVPWWLIAETMFAKNLISASLFCSAAPIQIYLSKFLILPTHITSRHNRALNAISSLKHQFWLHTRIPCTPTSSVRYSPHKWRCTIINAYIKRWFAHLEQDWVSA